MDGTSDLDKCKNILSGDVKFFYLLFYSNYYIIDDHIIMRFGMMLDFKLKKEIMERTALFSEANNTSTAETLPCLNQIIDACKDNDLKAQLYLYKLYYKEMFKLSLSIVKDLVMAEDIMRESFLAALENIGSCSEIINFDSRLKNIVEIHSHKRKPMIKG